MAVFASSAAQCAMMQPTEDHLLLDSDESRLSEYKRKGHHPLRHIKRAIVHCVEDIKHTPLLDVHVEPVPNHGHGNQHV